MREISHRLCFRSRSVTGSHRVHGRLTPDHPTAKPRPPDDQSYQIENLNGILRDKGGPADKWCRAFGDGDGERAGWHGLGVGWVERDGDVDVHHFELRYRADGDGDSW